MINLSPLINEISKEKNLSKKIVISALEKAFTIISRKKVGGISEVEAHYNVEYDSILIHKFKKVVESVSKDDLEIALKDAMALDPDVKLGEDLGLDITAEFLKNIKRNDLINLKQLVLNNIAKENKDLLVSEYQHKIGKLVTGIVKKVDENHLLVDLGKTEAVLHVSHLIQDESKRESERESTRERFKVNDRITAVLTEVQSTPQGAELRLSRKVPLFVQRLLEKEVPEIDDGTIVLDGIARVAGKRTVILVSSDSMPEVKTLQTILGANGYKMQNLTNQMNGEQLKVVFNTKNLVSLVHHLLKPIQVTQIVEQDDETVLLIVEDADMGKVIGSRNYNAILNSSILNAKLNTLKYSSLQEINDQFAKFCVETESLDESTTKLVLANKLLFKSDTKEEVMQRLQLKKESAEKVMQAISSFITKNPIKYDSAVSPKAARIEHKTVELSRKDQERMAHETARELFKMK